jgi:hypothetical protein
MSGRCTSRLFLDDLLGYGALVVFRHIIGGVHDLDVDPSEVLCDVRDDLESLDREISCFGVVRMPRPSELGSSVGVRVALFVDFEVAVNDIRRSGMSLNFDNHDAVVLLCLASMAFQIILHMSECLLRAPTVAALPPANESTTHEQSEKKIRPLVSIALRIYCKRAYASAAGVA